MTGSVTGHVTGINSIAQQLAVATYMIPLVCAQIPSRDDSIIVVRMMSYLV